jgi:hypothetical protein
MVTRSRPDNHDRSLVIRVVKISRQQGEYFLRPTGQKENITEFVTIFVKYLQLSLCGTKGSTRVEYRDSGYFLVIIVNF